MPVDLANDVDEDLFVFPQYGTALRQPIPPSQVTREDIYVFQPNHDMAEFLAGFNIGSDVDPAIDALIHDII